MQQFRFSGFEETCQSPCIGHNIEGRARAKHTASSQTVLACLHDTLFEGQNMRFHARIDQFRQQRPLGAQHHHRQVPVTIQVLNQIQQGDLPSAHHRRMIKKNDNVGRCLARLAIAFALTRGVLL